MKVGNDRSFDFSRSRTRLLSPPRWRVASPLGCWPVGGRALREWMDLDLLRGDLVSRGFSRDGFVYETVFDPQRGIVTTRRGLYFLRRRQQYAFTDFQRVEVRKRVRTGHRFSNLSDKTYDQVTQTSYDIILVGDRQELRVDSTQYQDKANNWAQKVGEVVRVEVG